MPQQLIHVPEHSGLVGVRVTSARMPLLPAHLGVGMPELRAIVHEQPLVLVKNYPRAVRGEKPLGGQLRLWLGPPHPNVSGDYFALELHQVEILQLDWERDGRSAPSAIEYGQTDGTNQLDRVAEPAPATPSSGVESAPALPRVLGS